MINNQFTIGTDVEFFVIDEQNNSISVEGKLGGTKRNPLSIGNGCNRQEDCVLAEFGTPPVMYGEEDKFVEYLTHCRKKGNEILEEFNLKLLACSSRHFDKKELNTEQAMTFGCEPSFNVYTQSVSIIPSPEEIGTLRSAGFHIHIGFPKNFFNDEYSYIQATEKIIKLMDLHLGIPSIVMDMDLERRSLYGKPGDFRFRNLENGIFVLEYRSLGGGLLGCEDSIRYIFNQTCQVIDRFLKGEEVPSNIEEDIRKIILNNNLVEAKNLISKFKITRPKVRIFEENLVYEI
jgi:hypothetical protein